MNFQETLKRLLICMFICGYVSGCQNSAGNDAIKNKHLSQQNIKHPTEKNMIIDIEESDKNSNESIKKNIDMVRPQIIVLPPYDDMAGSGRSPDIHKMIERALNSAQKISLVPFDFKFFQGVLYHQVFDKKYCNAILEKVNVDYIVMTKLDLLKKSSNMKSARWNLSVRVYDVKNDIQKNILYSQSLNSEEIESFIKNKISGLIKGFIQ